MKYLAKEAFSNARIAYLYCSIYGIQTFVRLFFELLCLQVAAFEVASDRMLLYNLIPVLVFIGLCFIGDSKQQLMFAKLISVAYGFVMLAVFVATANQIILESKCIIILVRFLIFYWEVFCSESECDHFLFLYC